MRINTTREHHLPLCALKIILSGASLSRVSKGRLGGRHSARFCTISALIKSQLFSTRIERYAFLFTLPPSSSVSNVYILVDIRRNGARFWPKVVLKVSSRAIYHVPSRHQTSIH